MYQEYPPRYFGFLIGCKYNVLRWIELILCMTCVGLAIAVSLTNVHVFIKIAVAGVPLILALVCFFDIISLLIRNPIGYKVWLIMSLASFLALCVCAGLLLFLKRSTKKGFFLIASLVFLATALIFLYDYIWTAIEYCRMQECCKIGEICCPPPYPPPGPPDGPPPDFPDGPPPGPPDCPPPGPPDGPPPCPPDGPPPCPQLSPQLSPLPCQPPLLFCCPPSYTPICLPPCPTPCPPCPPSCPSVFLSVCPPACPPVCPPACPPACPPVCPPACPPACPPVLPPVYPPVCPVTCPPTIPYAPSGPCSCGAMECNCPIDCQTFYCDRTYQTYHAMVVYNSQDLNSEERYVQHSAREYQDSCTDGSKQDDKSKYGFRKRNKNEEKQLPKFKKKIFYENRETFNRDTSAKKTNAAYCSKLDTISERDSRHFSFLNNTNEFHLHKRKQKYQKEDQSVFQSISRFFSPRDSKSNESSDLRLTAACQTSNTSFLEDKIRECVNCQLKCIPVDLSQEPSTSTAKSFSSAFSKDIRNNKVHPCSTNNSEQKRTLATSRIPRPLNWWCQSDVKKTERKRNEYCSSDGLTYRLDNKISPQPQRVRSCEVQHIRSPRKRRRRKNKVGGYFQKNQPECRIGENEDVNKSDISTGETYVTSGPSSTNLIYINNCRSSALNQNLPTEAPYICCNCANNIQLQLLREKDKPIYVYCTCGKCE